MKLSVHPLATFVAIIATPILHVGSSTGGNVTIPADTLSSGGGFASGGSGAGSIAVTSSLGVIIGTGVVDTTNHADGKAFYRCSVERR